MQDDWVPLQLPDNIDEMLTAWIESAEPKVGWCLLCNRPIRTEVDFILGTNTHDCEAGASLKPRIDWHNGSRAVEETDTRGRTHDYD
jgi:hypothetical protein